MIEVDGVMLQVLAERRRFGEKTMEIARQLLIDKVPPKRVAAAAGVNSQRVYAIRKTVLAAIEEEFGALPARDGPMDVFGSLAGVVAGDALAKHKAQICFRALGGEDVELLAREFEVSVVQILDWRDYLKSNAWKLFVRETGEAEARGDSA